MEVEKLMQLIDAVSSSALTEFQYESEGTKLYLARQESSLVSVQPLQVTEQKVPEVTVRQPKGETVDSPLVGTFYAAPAEDASPFVSVGDVVRKGQVLAIVEAMKLMNEIESTCEGTVLEVLVENGQMVEYGQPLFRIGQEDA